MKALHIITPVKDSIENTIETMEAISASHLNVPFTYTIYNDNSTPENTILLHQAGERLGIKVIDLADLTDHPSPNYLFVLRHCQKEALEANAGLLIVESDVIVKPDTLQSLWDGALSQSDCGIAAAVTVNDEGKINYPYEYARKWYGKIVDNKKHCSFCCSLITLNLLSKFDFESLDPTKNWFDVTISHESLKLGLHNILFCNLPVIHRPHSSRPWKLLKYKNPLLYYWKKYTKGLDKI